MIIEAEHLKVEYGQSVVLSDINFYVNKGDYLNIIGPNGSGKTTLIKLLTNLQKPSQGKLNIAPVVFGYLPQHLSQSAQLPANVYEVLKFSNAKKPTDEAIKKLLSDMGMLELMYHPMRKLSGGEQQRVYIIRALLSNPDVLILDEPTSALDPEFRKFFYAYIEKLNDNGMTIIHVTHDLSDGLRHGSRILELDQVVKFFGTFEQYQLLGHKKGGHHHHV
ncbi:MAG: ATP-binding cassette domain-containing protein [Acholeplasma sp.]|jgi:zinc transport system ATP-binding protein|nr:ATP-binding cassette domain-containing protein [Acholeplasma sp.]